VLIEYLALGTEVPASGCEARRTAMRDELLSRTGEVSGREVTRAAEREAAEGGNSNGRAEERGRRTEHWVTIADQRQDIEGDDGYLLRHQRKEVVVVVVEIARRPSVSNVLKLTVPINAR